MGALKYYKRDPDKALSGMMRLSLEERGAYNTVLDLIYSNDNRLADDDRFICGWLRCDLRVWRRIKHSLIAHEKIYIEDGFIRNFRATSVIDEALSSSLSLSEANRIKGIKSGEARRKNNHLVEPGVEPKTNLLITKAKARIEEKDSPSLLPLTVQHTDPVAEAVSLFNETSRAINGSQCSRINKARRSAIQARLKDCDGIEGWKAALARARASPWCRGEVNAEFKFNIDFLCADKNFTRLMEGLYDDRKNNRPKPAPRNDYRQHIFDEAQRLESTLPFDHGEGD